jgi:hypothetical protein
MAVTYKSDKIVADRIEIFLDFDNDGVLNIANSRIQFWNSRCLGGNDGKLQIGLTSLQTILANPEAIMALDQAIMALYQDPDHLSILAKNSMVKDAPLVVDGVDFVDPNP